MVLPNLGQIRLEQIANEVCNTSGERQFGTRAVDSLINNDPSAELTARNMGQFYGERGDRVGWSEVSAVYVGSANGLGNSGIRFGSNGTVERFRDNFNSGAWTVWTTWELNNEIDSVQEAEEYAISYTKISGGLWTTLPPNNSTLNFTRTFIAGAGNNGVYDITVYSRRRSCDTKTRRVELGRNEA